MIKVIVNNIFLILLAGLIIPFSCSNHGGNLRLSTGEGHDTTISNLPSDTGESQNGSDFILWQLPCVIKNVHMSYVFKINNGQVAVLDGGWGADAKLIRDKLVALGDTVDAWFVSHPHEDHMGALNAVLEDPEGIRIKHIYYSRLTDDQIQAENHTISGQNNADSAFEYYHTLDTSSVLKTNFRQPGAIITLGQTHFKILSVSNPEIITNVYNNSSMAIRVWDDKKSFVFLGDLGIEGGDKLLNSPYKDDLNCDYLQMAHHGNHGVGSSFYRRLKFSACLWPTPEWLWNNNVGGGYNTGPYSTVLLRNFLRDTMGVTRNYVQWQGVSEIR